MEIYVDKRFDLFLNPYNGDDLCYLRVSRVYNFFQPTKGGGKRVNPRDDMRCQRKEGADSMYDLLTAPVALL
jgi:hypothetical protein